MKKLLTAIRHYYLFAAAAVAAIVALPLELAGWHVAARWILIVVSTLELLPLLWNMWQSLRQGKYGVDILAATAIISSVLLHQYWAGIVIVLMLTGGSALEDYAGHRAGNDRTAHDRRTDDAHGLIL